MSRTDRLVFVYPTFVLGGAEVLFLRMSSELADRSIPVAVVDHPNGAIAQRADRRVERIAPGRALASNDVAITTLATVPLLRQYRRDLRCLVWSLHPENVTTLLPRYRFGSGRREHRHTQTLLHPVGLPQLRRDLQRLHHRGGLVFQDGANVRFVEKITGLRVAEPALCPICIPDPPTDRLLWPGDGRLRIAWVGRLARDKWFALQRAIVDLERAADQLGPIDVTVIGDGPFRDALRSVLPQHVSLSSVGQVEPNELPSMLAGHHAMVGMGTSLLEAARLGLPTIVADSHQEPLPGGLPYRWVQELKDFDVGEVVSAKRPPLEGRPLAELLSDLLDRRKWEQLSGDATRHASRHGVAPTTSSLLDHTRRTAATAADAALLSDRFVGWHELATLRRRLPWHQQNAAQGGDRRRRSSAGEAGTGL
jgi:glycosyltransferase involved in cell wall biosynthesis